MPETNRDPYYRLHVFICTNQRVEGHRRGCCHRRGATGLRDYMKARAKELGLTDGIRIQQAGCLDRCELGPMMVIYPEGVWYAPRSREDIDEILTSHVRDGRPLERLLVLPSDQTPQDQEARGV